MDLHPLDTISLCAGGAGLDLALELAVPGSRSVVMVEREGFAAAQLVSAMEAGHLPPAPIWSDVRTFDGKPWRGLVDGLIGGIPCQPHSLAGRKGGQHDARDLWTDARRIIATSRPWFVLIENVAGMLSAGDDEIAGAERVWRDLRKLGFAVEGGLFTAAEVGASHERERIFILGLANPFGQRGRSGHGGRQDAAHGDASGQGSVGPVVEHSPSQRRGEGRAEPELRSGRDAVASADGDVVDSIGGGRDGREEGPERRSIGRAADERSGREVGGAAELADADLAELRGQPPAGKLAVDEHHARLGVFPPGPNDISGWRDTLERAPELEPAFRRVADGLASRLDIARVDRLRLLGNGVVPLAGSYAIRTLAHRLAARGAAGADELVRMMDQSSPASA